LVASYNLQPGNGEGLSLVSALHKFVTYLLTYLDTFLQPRDLHRAYFLMYVSNWFICSVSKYVYTSMKEFTVTLAQDTEMWIKKTVTGVLSGNRNGQASTKFKRRGIS